MLWLTAGCVRRDTLGRPREGALFDDREEVLELEEIHVSPCCWRS